MEENIRRKRDSSVNEVGTCGILRSWPRISIASHMLSGVTCLASAGYLSSASSQKLFSLLNRLNIALPRKMVGKGASGFLKLSISLLALSLSFLDCMYRVIAVYFLVSSLF